MQTHERLGHEVVRIRLILHVAPREGEKGPLPAGDQLAQGGILSSLQSLQTGLVGDGFRIHGMPRGVSVQEEITSNLEHWTQQPEIAFALLGSHLAGGIGDQPLRGGETLAVAGTALFDEMRELEKVDLA